MIAKETDQHCTPVLALCFVQVPVKPENKAMMFNSFQNPTFKEAVLIHSLYSKNQTIPSNLVC